MRENTFPKGALSIEVEESTAYVKIACDSIHIAEDIMEQLTFRGNCPT